MAQMGAEVRNCDPKVLMLCFRCVPMFIPGIDVPFKGDFEHRLQVSGGIYIPNR